MPNWCESTMTKSKIIVAPSILSADPLKFAEEIKSVEQAGADWHHIDVMDGHFVPNLTFGPPLIRALKSVATIPLDVHIMVDNPDAVALDYVKAGADYLSFHIEAATHAQRVVQAIKGQGAKAGVALNPGTAIASVGGLLPYVDYVLVMSVNPGFGGQQYLPHTASRLAELRKMLTAIHRQDEVIVEVDGGINAQTGQEVCAAGASALVAGTFIYGAKNRADAVQALRFSK